MAEKKKRKAAKRDPAVAAALRPLRVPPAKMAVAAVRRKRHSRK